MKRLWIILGLILVAVCVVAAIAGAFFWYSMQRPLYVPGMVRARENLSAPLMPPEQPDDTESWSVENGIQLYHFPQGEGRNVLIVHGGPGFPPAEPWPGLDPLGDDYQFHYYHQRGSGQSTRPFDRFTSPNRYQNLTELDRTLGLGAQVADIERIRQILGEEKLILIGHSFGGFLASLYAAEFPDRVEGLVLIAPADMLVMPQKREGLFEEIRKRLPEDMLEAYDAYMEDYLDFQDIFSESEAELAALNEGYIKYYAAVADTPEQVQAEPGGWMVQAIYFSMGRRHDYRDALKDVQAPVLVVHGAGDLQPEEASRAYVDAFPNARLHILEDATHFPFYEQPGAFAGIIDEFLDSLE